MKIERRLFRSLVALSLAFLLAIGNVTCFADAERPDKNKAVSHNRPAYKEGELLIKFRDGTSSQIMSAFSSENGLKHVESFDSMNIGLYTIKSGKSMSKAIKALEDNDEIEYVQPNYLYYPDSVPNDEYYDELWGLDAIDAPKAWDIAQGNDVVVAVIDTGIDFDHPELSNRIWRNPRETENGEDDDGNGLDDDIYGWDFYNGDNSVCDDESEDEHGTHIAGIIAAEENDYGVIGVAPGVKLMALKFIGPDGYGTTVDAIDAINYAKAKGADIINASWGGSPEGEPNDRLLREAIEASGLLFVTAAGNGNEFGIGYNIDTIPVYPASFSSSNILTVTAVKSSEGLPTFSNYGAISVDVGAPGYRILSTVTDAVYGIAAVKASGIGTAGMGDAFVGAFGLEGMILDEDAYDLLSRALSGISTDAEILLVDDGWNNGDDDFYDLYSTALDDSGYEDVEPFYVASDIDNGPNLDKMREYDVIVWFTGYSWGGEDEGSGEWISTLTIDDQNNMMDYLDAGGTLILFGEDALYDIEESALVNNYFGIEISLSDYGRNKSMEGAGGTAFESIHYDIPSGYYYLRDHFEIVGEDTEALLYYPEEDGEFYDYLSGTSMAAPHVTGTAALLLSKNPDLTVAQLKTAIMGSGKLLTSLNGKTASGRMVNAFNALNAVPARTPVNPSPSTGKKGGGGAPAAPNPSIDSKIAAALKSAKTGANIEIPMVRINGIDSVSMSAKTIEDLSKSGKSLTLTGSGADITIPASALMTEEVKKLIGDSTAKLSINVREITGEEAKKFAGNTGSGIFMVGDRVFEFTAELKTSTETVNISKFVQELKVSIKLSAAELKGIDGNKLGVYFYNADKKAWEYVGGVFNSQTGTMTFGTGHFSQYAVMRADGTYTDIGKHWAKPEIELMAAKHIIEAAAGGEFGPDVNITRAEVIKMLVNLLRYDPDRNVDLITPATATFKDVSVGSPYFSYVETAVKYGITTGNAGGTFGPDDTVTREQFATMIIRAMGIVTDSDSSILPFDDKGDIPEWAEKSVIAAYERGLMTGIGGNKFGVGSTATRAQAAVTIKRVMEKSGLILVPEKLTGKLVISDIEVQHYELETADGIYVIIHDADNKYLEKLLSRSVGKDIEAIGYEQSGYNIYQRGKLFKAISIQVK